MVNTKTKTAFVCQSCGSEWPKWSGFCAQCESWNTIVEQPISRETKGYSGSVSDVTPLSSIITTEFARQSTGLTELDRVLGGGILPGLVVLIGGDPGVGKSTILLQALANLAQTQKALYVTGEESLQQITMRAKRLGSSIENIFALAETCVEQILQKIEKHKPTLVVIDSIQTLYTQALTSAPGSVGQVREATAKLVQYAKTHEITLFIIGHVTKEGMLAGPRVLEHMVDTVLYFEGDPNSRFRMIRAVKNRYGAVNELGVFVMTEGGLKAVTNPSAIFLSQERTNVPGHIVTVTWEGSRPILIEVQALVDESYLTNPRRVGIGVDHHRLSMLLAVLHKHASIKTFDKDVYINVVGGLKFTETAPDLAMLLAIYSSLTSHCPPPSLLSFGEVGLAGEIRPIPYGVERLQEAYKHGFKAVMMPKSNVPKKLSLDIKVIGVTHVHEAIESLDTLTHTPSHALGTS